MAASVDQSEKSFLIGELDQAIDYPSSKVSLKQRLLSSVSERFIYRSILATLAICWSTGIIN
ncbi:hypothetical protein FS837_006869, partial [Tulasnella sp. UAMH 9824]